MSRSQKFNEDKLLRLEWLPDFCTIATYNVTLPTTDEIICGLVEFARTKKVTLWLCLATQILLDTFCIMRYSSPSGAFADLRMSGLRTKKTIEDFWKLSESHPKPSFWPKEGDEEIKNIHTCVETWIVQDPLLEVRRAAEQALRKPNSPEEKHKFPMQHPVLCGLIMFHLYLRMQEIGQGLVNQWYDVQQLAFLYNLVKQVPGMRMTWPDMDAFINIHGEGRIFVGNRPKDASESLNRLEVVTGISSVIDLAPNSRNKNRINRPTGKAKLLEPATMVANLFRSRFAANDRMRIVTFIPSFPPC